LLIAVRRLDPQQVKSDKRPTDHDRRESATGE
jgi:hypothetical protein